MKQEKLCEAEDMMPEELGAANNMYVDPKELEKFRRQLDPYAKPKVKTEANTRQIGETQHYKKMDIQPWDAMEAWLSPEEFRGFLIGNSIKYLARAGKKGPYKEDIQKAHHYLEKLLEVI